MRMGRRWSDRACKPLIALTMVAIPLFGTTPFLLSSDVYAAYQIDPRWGPLYRYQSCKQRCVGVQGFVQPPIPRDQQQGA